MPNPYYTDDRVRIYCGDMMEVVGELDVEFTACVTDPPYGLSEDSPQRVLNRLLDLLFDVVLPDFDQVDTAAIEDRLLSGVPISGSSLSRSKIRSVVESGVSVPEGAVNLNSDVAGFDEEIKAGDVSASLGGSQSMLSHKVDAEGGHFIGDYILDARHTIEFARRNGFSGFMPELLFSGFSMPVAPVFAPRFPCLLSVLSKGFSSFRRDVIGLVNDALGITKASPFVMAGSGAVNTFMLRFDLAGESLEFVPTRRARKGDSILPHLACPKLIRAGSATGSLPSVFEPVRVRFVHLTADGTFPVYFHLWMHRDWKEKLSEVKQGGGFMNQGWDTSVPSQEMWRAVSDALLPGAPLLAFGGTRKWHRLAVAIEDAGFELRDTLMWMYGGGFPKSLDISKGIDKMKHTSREDKYRFTAWMRKRMDEEDLSRDDINEAAGVSDMALRWTTDGQQPEIPTVEQWQKIRPLIGPAPDWLLEIIGPAYQPSESWENREKVGEREKLESWDYEGNRVYDNEGQQQTTTIEITKPNREAAARWNGWGTALKPSWEPVLLAMNPKDGTFAENALEHGVAGLNIDGCRIETDEDTSRKDYGRSGASVMDNNETGFDGGERINGGHLGGRWPANLVLDEQAAEMVDGQSDDGSRFFYTSKATRADRNSGFADVDNDHPTVKPSDLMKWLCRLVKMPERNHILDPFGGSGTTAFAAKELGMDCTIIEQEEQYCEIAAKRLRQQTLF